MAITAVPNLAFSSSFTSRAPGVEEKQMVGTSGLIVLDPSLLREL